VLFARDSEVAVAAAHRDERQRFCAGETWKELDAETL
jgi:hypothetical protein